MSRPMPKNVIAIFTNTCHFRCRFCAWGHYTSAFMKMWTLDQIKERLGVVFDHAEWLNVGGSGEIGLLPYFDELIDYLGTKPGKVVFTSNGHRLNNEAIRRHGNIHDIRISLHSVVEETYDDLTGTRGCLARTMDNVRKLAAKPRSYALRVGPVVTERNVRELPKLATFVVSAGVDEVELLALSTPEIPLAGKPYPEDLPLRDSEENWKAMKEAETIAKQGGVRFRGLMSDIERPVAVSHLIKTCKSPTEQVVINLDGTVRPCCFLDTVFGNILEQPFEEIWNSDAYNEFRRQVAAGECEACLVCRNWG